MNHHSAVRFLQIQMGKRKLQKNFFGLQVAGQPTNPAETLVIAGVKAVRQIIPVKLLARCCLHISAVGKTWEKQIRLLCPVLTTASNKLANGDSLIHAVGRERCMAALLSLITASCCSFRILNETAYGGFLFLLPL